MGLPSHATQEALAGLDAVRWAELGHAYGSAVDVPDLIRAVACGTDDAARQAWSELHGNLWHQGTVYQATGHAVPILLRLFFDRERTDRRAFGQYLELCAQGTSFLAVHQPLLGPPTAEDQAQLGEELAWVAEVMAAFVRHEGELRRVVDDQGEEDGVRSDAFTILAAVPACRGGLFADLSRFLRHSSVLLRARAALLLRSVPADRVVEDELREALEVEEDEMVLTCLALAAVALPPCGGAWYAFARLACFLLEGDSALEQRLAELGYDWEDPGNFIEDACVKADGAMRRGLVAELGSRLCGAQPRRKDAELLLTLSFPGRGWSAGKIAVTDLDGDQRAALSILGRCAPLWDDHQFMSHLQGLGLPTKRVALQRLIDGQPESAVVVVPSVPQAPPVANASWVVRWFIR